MRREANLWRGAIYRRFQPIVCCQPARSGEGHFLAVSPGLFLAVSPRLFLAVSPGFFSGCVARVVAAWLCRQVCSLTVLSGISSVGSDPGYPGCVIKG